MPASHGCSIAEDRQGCGYETIVCAATALAHIWIHMHGDQGYASAFGALFTFVGIAPHLLQNLYGHGAEAFGVMQIVMVAAFMAGSLLASRATQALGRERAISIGFCFLGVTAALILLVASGVTGGNAFTVTLAMLPSQFGLGLRFGIAMSAAIGSVPDRQSSASAMVSFLCFLFAAVGNAATALWIDHALVTTALVCLGFTIISLLALVITPDRGEPEAAGGIKDPH